MPVDRAIVRQIPLFATLVDEDLAHVAAMMVERRYERGDIILLQGEPGGALHYVHAGLVKVFKTSPEGKEQVLRLIGPGHTFSASQRSMVGPTRQARRRWSRAWSTRWDALKVRKLIVERPGVAEGAVRSMAEALRHLVDLVENLSFRHVTARVAKVLLDEAAMAQEGQSAHRLTQQEMAAMVGTAREMVGRALKEMEAAGAIEMRQGHAVVLDGERCGCWSNARSPHCSTAAPVRGRGRASGPALSACSVVAHGRLSIASQSL